MDGNLHLWHDPISIFARKSRFCPVSAEPTPLLHPYLEYLEERSTPSAITPLPANRSQASLIAQTMPMQFEANQGQAAPQVQYLARGQGYQVFLGPTRAVVALRAETWNSEAVFSMNLVGASETATGHGLQRIGQSNYLIGSDASDWITGVPGFARVEYAGVYEGIDLAYYGKQGEVEFDFIVHPGADATRIALDLEGAFPLRLDTQGNLIATLGESEIQLDAPVAYQVIAGQRTMVDCHFVIDTNSTVHFEVEAYNPGATLVIDPVLTYSEWMGGNWDDIGRAIKTDASGAIYLAGDTGSRVADGMYMSAYAFDTTYNGPPPGPVYGTGDIFVRKIANNYVYSTYLGGTGNDFVKDLAVDAYGCVYLTGNTLSSNFPVTPYAYRTHYAGNGSHPLGDAFVTRLNPSGSGLVFSTFLGGAGDDRGNALSLDGYGNVYVIGETNSTNLPVKGAYQDHLINTTPFGGISNAFLASFRSNGVARYVTYFGGNDAIGTGIAVDQVGNTFIGGMNGQVPTTPDVYCPSEPAGTRSWVSRFNSSGSTLAYSTYLPGCSVSGLGNDGKGNIYVTGTVNSFAEANGFVTTPGAYQSTYGGGESDIFVTKLHAGAGSLAYSTYLGGSGTYEISSGSIAVDKRFGSVAVAGGTFSDDFPIYNPLAGQYAHNGGYEDGFVTRLLPSGEGVTFSTFLGGNLEDRVNDVSMDGQGVIYVTGWTTSTDFPIVGSDVKLKLKDVFVSRIVSAPIFVQFAQLHVSAPETVGVVTLNLERNTTSGTTRVHFTTQDGTAVAGEDYEGKSGVVTFLPGQTTKAIAVRVFNDSLVEGTESFYVSLSSPSGAILGMNTEAEIQIRDNDLFPSLAAPAMTSRDNVLLTVATSNNLEESALSTVAADGWASQVNGSSLLLPPTRTGEVVESAGPFTRNNVESPTTVVTFERPAIPPKFTSPIVTTTVRMPAGPTVVGVSDVGWTNPVWVDVF